MVDAEAGIVDLGGDRAWIEADDLGRVTAINDRFTGEFGWSREALVGRPILTLVPVALHDAHNLRFSRFVEFGEPGEFGQPLRLPVVTAGGETMITETSLYAERRQGRWRLSAHLERVIEGGPPRSETV